MNKVVFIKQNSEEIRKKLKDAGFSVCVCAVFPESVWLDHYPDSDMPYKIHGVGYTDPAEGVEHLTPLERINVWLSLEGHYPEEKEFFESLT